MTKNEHSHSNKSTRNGEGSTIGQGVLYPLEFLNHLHDITSLAELKVIGCVLGYDAIVGVEAEPLTFTDLQERTGLTKKSLSEGIKRAVERKIVYLHEQNGSRFFLPKEKSIPHVHESFKTINSVDFKLLVVRDHEHEGVESIPRQEIHQILLSEFGMTKSPRVARDICLTPKYTLDRLINQLRYTRWEVKRGQDSNPQKPIRNAAGRFIYRLKHNEPIPRDFDFVTSLTEDEGWSTSELYEAIYTGKIDLPHLKDTFGFAAWLQNEFGEEFD